MHDRKNQPPSSKTLNISTSLHILTITIIFLSLTPAEWYSTGSISSLFHKWLVELTAGSGVDLGPAMLTVVLQTSDVGTEERGKLSTTARTLALITHLIIQHIRLHFNLFQQIVIKINKFFKVNFKGALLLSHLNLCY